VAELDTLFAKMKGQTCWSMIGISAGSWFSLDFGARLKRDIAIGNETLRENQREFTGEYRLFVQMAAWRLYRGSDCICHCNDLNVIDGPMVLGLRQLEQQKVLNFRFGESSPELTIDFSDEYRLFLSDWEPGIEPDAIAYWFYGDGLAVSVQMNGIVCVQPYQRVSKIPSK
jgi:hypothetical protein